METTAKLKFSHKFGWAIGELAIACFVVLQMAFMLYYCTEALKIPPGIAGTVLLIPRLLDAFADPLMGALSDRTKSKFGRRRLFLLLGAPFLAIAFAAVFFVPADAPMGLKLSILLVTFLLSNAAVTIYEVPYSAMAAEMTQNYKERTQLAGYKMFAARFAGVLTVIAAPKIFGSTNNIIDGFQVLGVCVGIFICITGLWTFFATKDAPSVETKVHKFSLKDEIDAVIKNISFRKLWIAFFLQNLAIGASATASIYFLTHIMQIKRADTGIYLFSGAIAALIATPIWVALASKLGKQKGYFLGITISCLLAVPAIFLMPEQAIILIPILIIAGIGDAATQLFPNAMIPDTVEADELRSGCRREGAIFGAWGFARKLGMTGGAFIVSIALSYVGFASGVAPNLQTPEALMGVRYIYALLPIILWIGTALAFSQYDLTEAKFNQIKQEIKDKKAS